LATTKFGASLAQKANWPEDDKIFEGAKIQQWCEFDSDVGFGKFELDTKSTMSEGTEVKKAKIILRESFLTASVDTEFQRKSGNDEDNHRYCSFMTGYIQGVLNKILKNQVEVTHKPLPERELENHFKEIYGTKSESCLFEVFSIG